MRLDRIFAAAFVVLVSTAIVGFSAGSTSASFTASTTNPGESWNTSNVAAPASLTTTSKPAGQVDLSWPATTTPPNGHTVTYLILRGGTQIASSSSLSYSDTPASDGTYAYTIQTKIAQGAGFFTSTSSPAQNGISDRVAPTMSILCNGAACSSTTWYSTLNVTVTGTDAGSGMASGSVTRSVDGGANVPTAGATATFSITGDSATHSVAYFGADTAGNVSGTTTFSPLKVDQTPPTAATGLSGTSITPGQIIAWWTASTDASSGLAGYTAHRTNAVTSCPTTLNTANFPVAVASTGTTAGVNFTGLTSTKKYCYYVTATDVAGNSSTSATASALITSN